MRQTLILTILSLSLFSLSVFADQLTLKNGDRLSGTIAKSDDDAKTLLIKADLAGEVTVKWDAITAIVSSQPLHIMLSDGRMIVGRVSTTDGILEVATDGGTVPAAHDAVKAIRDNATQAEIDRLQHPGLRDYWSGLFDLGLSLTEGNSSTAALTIAGKASRVVPKNKLTLYYTELYSRDSNESPARTTANAIHGGVRDEFNLKPRVYVFAFTDFDEDALQHLDLSNVLGGVFAYHVITPKKTQFALFAGGSFNQEYFASYTIANPAPPPVLLFEPSQSRHSAELVPADAPSIKLGTRTPA